MDILFDIITTNKLTSQLQQCSYINVPDDCPIHTKGSITPFVIHSPGIIQKVYIPVLVFFVTTIPDLSAVIQQRSHIFNGIAYFIMTRTNEYHEYDVRVHLYKYLNTYLSDIGYYRIT